jgi:predicted nucleic acid-binding protein
VGTPTGGEPFRRTQRIRNVCCWLRLGKDVVLVDRIEAVFEESQASLTGLREIYFLWRPFLRDPTDEMVLELGVEARAAAIVTHNIRDFWGVEERFGIRVVTPGAFLLELREGER